MSRQGNLLYCEKLVEKIELPSMRPVRVRCRAAIDMETRRCTVCGGVYGSSMRKKSKR